MSLNGLDDSRISDAYQVALDEGAGWLLLKYASRDMVELLWTGKSGVDEARDAVARYPDKSPLYGFLHHNSQKVLVKYVPEGTSRLLQARVTVHSHDVAEKFHPDVVHTVRTANDLTEAALSAAFSLHAVIPPAPLPASSSEEAARLHEVVEATEELPSSDHGRDGADSSREEDIQTSERDSVAELSGVPKASLPLAHAGILAHIIPTSGFLSTPGLRSPNPLQNSPGSKENGSSEISAQFVVGLHSRQSEDGGQPSLRSQASLSDLYHHANYNKPPKIKLGPRLRAANKPSAEGTSPGRDELHPVASLPPGIHATPRKPFGQRPISSRSQRSYTSAISRKPAAEPTIPIFAVPPLPQIEVSLPPRPASKAGSAISFAPSLKATSMRSQTMTPERQRLMKALQLRKRQLGIAPPVPSIPETAYRSNRAPSPEQTNGHIMTAQRSDASSDATVTLTSLETNCAVPVDGCDRSADDDNVPSVTSPSSLEDSELASTAPSSVSDFKELEEQRVLKSESPSALVPVTIRLDPLTYSETSTVQSSLPMHQQSYLAIDPLRIPTKTPKPGVDKELQQTIQDSYRFQPNQCLEVLSRAFHHSRKLSDGREKRYGLVEPLTTDFSEDGNSEYMSDDSFMEELRSAEVKEAKTIYATTIAGAPSNILFPNPPGVERRPSSNSVMSVMIRRSSTLSSRRDKHSERSAARAESKSAEMRRTLSVGSAKAGSDSYQPISAGKKRAVSNGISKRIEALAGISTRDPEPVPVPPSRTSTFRTPLKSGAASVKSLQPSPRPTSAASFSPMSGLYSLRGNTSLRYGNNIQTLYDVQERRGKAESISVTARIIRTTSPERFGAYSHFHQSPLTIDRQPVENVGSSIEDGPPSEQLETRTSHQSRLRSKLMFGLNVERGSGFGRGSPQPPSREPSSSSLARPSVDGSWRHFKRRSRETRSSTSVPRTTSTSSIGESLADERLEEKRESRTSRLLKRVSLMSSGSRRSLLNQPVREETVEENADAQPSIAEVQTPPSAVDVGDLNVQFPDTLLWKRRCVHIDDHGYLVIGFSKIKEQVKGNVKQFHLTEFRTPFAPDRERQEMPHSIVLEFANGSSLQCACEDRAGQLHTLNTLQDYHQAWQAQR